MVRTYLLHGGGLAIEAQQRFVLKKHSMSKWPHAPLPLAQGYLPAHSLEVGIRQDEGDAETGFGMDIGAAIGRGMTRSTAAHGTAAPW
ncbi:MAG: hypothetical protein OXF25_11050 [Cyanobacteria bacterium MAG CAR3_bin_5]|nr:hypothetical protein [Cyanobacteria bacterium MAG CAR3_bin_5]